MKKIFLSLLFVLLSIPAFAQGIYLPVASGTVTQANMKISAVDGTSFIDFTAANVLTGKTGNLLVVRDSSGRAIQGFIKAAGTGETYSENILINGNMENPITGWTQRRGTLSAETVDFVEGTQSGKFTRDAVSTEGYFNQVVGLSLFGLYKLDGAVKNVTSTYMRVRVGPIGNYKDVQPVTNTQVWTEFSEWYVPTAEENIFLVNVYGTDGNYGLADNLSVKQILTPSATGVTIVSTKGGATFNWAQKNASFNYNDSSGYTYQIYKVLNAPVVDSDACANANATINLSAGSAAWSCTGIDDAAYQDGKHIIAVYDTAGVAAFGYYKASGSGAVVNANGGATQNWISIGTGFSTAGNYTRKVLYVGD